MEMLTVIVPTDLFLVLALRVDNYLRNHLGYNVFEQFWGENHLCPIVASLQGVKDIPYMALVVKKTSSGTKRDIPLKSILPSKYAS